MSRSDWKRDVLASFERARKALPRLGGSRKKRSKKLNISLKRGALTKFGFHIDLPANQRHEALAKAVRKDGYAKVLKRVVLLKTYNKHQPYLRKKVDSDVKWLRRYYGSKKKSLRRSRSYSRKRSSRKRYSRKRYYGSKKKSSRRSRKRSSKKRYYGKGGVLYLNQLGKFYGKGGAFEPVDPRQYVKNLAKKYYSASRGGKFRDVGLAREENF
jgi:hypothetical protein